MICPELINGCGCNINDFFQKDDTTHKGIVIYDFQDDKSDIFINQFIIPFRRTYLSDIDLDYEIKENINNRENAIANKLPTAAYLKSGEFAEILMFFLACHYIYPDANVNPIKWHWKEHRDAPCHLTDIVLLKCLDEINPQEDDYIFSMEVKAGATPIGARSIKSRMNDAIEGAVKDKDSRVGKMIAYLTTKYAKERNGFMARKVRRFGESVEIKYDRHISAAIVVERDSLQYHINNISEKNRTSALENSITLFAIPISRLKDIYESVYAQTPKQG